MVFSLVNSYEEIFGSCITFKERLKVWRDMRKIKRRYRKDRGFLKAFRVNGRKIMFGFDLYLANEFDSPETIMQLWDEFAYFCLEEGADFLDLYI